MKRLTLIASLLLATITMTAQDLYVGTYNIRNDNKGDRMHGNGWDVRRDALCAQIAFEHPDAFGTQEILYSQLTDMRDRLKGYDFIGVGREDGKQKGEFSAIFYRADKLKLLDSGNFWLNETPDVPKLGWDAACIRICTWGKFKDKATKLTFFHFNIHMDHIGIVARREASKLIVKKIKEIAGTDKPVILTGDFNVDQHNDIFNIFKESGILVDSYDAAEQRFAEIGTFNDFNTSSYTDRRIDHVFVSPTFRVLNYGVLTNSYWTEEAGTEQNQSTDTTATTAQKKYVRRAPSDHYPVLVKLSYDKKR